MFKHSACGITLPRRKLLTGALYAAGMLVVGPTIFGPARLRAQTATGNLRRSNIPNLAGTLHEVVVENDPDRTRMLVPRGFTVRELARTGRPVLQDKPYVWHRQPDGGAVIPLKDSGWVYTSNSEINRRGEGGVGALRFNARGELIDSYSICSGTRNNCAGGPTPWGTWLTCEEIPLGLVYECDPTGQTTAVAFPALGAFTHEAVAVDPVRRHLYLTEDMPDGNLYRFVPDHYPLDGRADLGSGRLEVAIADSVDVYTTRTLGWAPVPVPIPANKSATPTRKQVPGAAHFNGGEGIWYHEGSVYFSSKGDNRVWALDTHTDALELIYDKQRDGIFNPGIKDVDNVTVSAGGDVVVAEDGSEMRLIVVGKGQKPFELINVIGHEGSEITGPAFSPDGSRLYFSSQSGIVGDETDGRTYEMRGPFFI